MLIETALDPSVKPLPDERLDSLVQDLEVELAEIGALFPMRYVWGRKPLETQVLTRTTNEQL